MARALFGNPCHQHNRSTVSPSSAIASCGHRHRDWCVLQFLTAQFSTRDPGHTGKITVGFQDFMQVNRSCRVRWSERGCLTSHLLAQMVYSVHAMT